MLFSMFQFVKAAGSWVNPQHRNGLLAATLFFWVVPMISVHFSSETLSTACLLLLLAGLLRREQPSVREALWMGIVAAIGFEFRYQMAFALVGILAWILVVGRYRWQIWSMAALGFIGVLVLCFALDCWFYGKMVFTPYNYYYINIVKHVAASFGESPWYVYLISLGSFPGLALGIPLVISLCVGTIRYYRNPVVWAFWSFLLLHSAISHKEPRFIFPLMPMLPLFVVWTYDLVFHKQNRLVAYAVIGPLVLVNTGGLVHVVFNPAASGKATMMKYLCKKASEKKSLRVRTKGISNPFRTGPLIADFYLWQPVEVEEDNGSNIEEDSKADMVVLRQGDIEDRRKITANGYSEVYRSIPQWQDALNRFYPIYNPNSVLIAYEKE